MLLVVLFQMLTVATVPVAPLVATDSIAIREVLATTQKFFDTMRTKDTAAMRLLMEPGARLVGMRSSAQGVDHVQTISVDQWLAFVAKDTRGPWIERAWEPEVRIDGTLATVWAAYDFHFGTTPSHCGTDAVQLLKTPDGWKITSIADTYRTSACPPHAPPVSRP